MIAFLRRVHASLASGCRPARGPSATTAIGAIDTICLGAMTAVPGTCFPGARRTRSGASECSRNPDRLAERGERSFGESSPERRSPTRNAGSTTPGVDLDALDFAQYLLGSFVLGRVEQTQYRFSFIRVRLRALAAILVDDQIVRDLQ